MLWKGPSDCENITHGLIDHVASFWLVPAKILDIEVSGSLFGKGPFTLSESESEKDQRIIRKDQSVSGKTSKKMFVFAIAIVQCKWTLKVKDEFKKKKKKKIVFSPTLMIFLKKFLSSL